MNKTVPMQGCCAPTPAPAGFVEEMQKTMASLQVKVSDLIEKSDTLEMRLFGPIPQAPMDNTKAALIPEGLANVFYTHFEGLSSGLNIALDTLGRILGRL